MSAAVVEEDGLGQLVLLGQRKNEGLQQGLAQLLRTLSHLVGRDGHYRVGAGVGGADRGFRLGLDRLAHREEDAVLPLAQLLCGGLTALLFGHFRQVLDGDLVVHQHLHLACASQRGDGFLCLDHGQRAGVSSGIHSQHDFSFLSYVLSQG